MGLEGGLLPQMRSKLWQMLCFNLVKLCAETQLHCGQTSDLQKSGITCAALSCRESVVLCYTVLEINAAVFQGKPLWGSTCMCPVNTPLWPVTLLSFRKWEHSFWLISYELTSVPLLPGLYPNITYCWVPLPNGPHSWGLPSDLAQQVLSPWESYPLSS